MNTNLNLYQINTTAWEEEDFLLMTSLTEEQITKVITPIVEKEREREQEMFAGENPSSVSWIELVAEYDNDYLVGELVKAYPDAVIIHYTLDNIDLISI